MLRCLLLLVFFGLGFSGAAPAQTVRGFMNPADKNKLDANRIGVITGGPGGTYIRLGTDLARLLDDHETLEMRVVVMVGKGSIQNIDDLLHLARVDVAVVQGDVLDHLQRLQAYDGIQDRVGYISRLYNEELHILARDGLAEVGQLDGRRVNVGERNSGTFLTASRVIDLLGLDVEIHNDNDDAALAKLIAGDIDAMMFVAGKPASLFARITPEAVRGADLRFLSIPGEPLSDSYVGGRLTGADYPSLIPAGSEVTTWAVPSVLAAFLWRGDHWRYAPVAKFTRLFFDRFAGLSGPGYVDKWREVDIHATLPGWTRFRAAAEWLAEHPARTESCFDRFRRELAASGRDADAMSAEERFEAQRRWQVGQPPPCG